MIGDEKNYLNWPIKCSKVSYFFLILPIMNSKCSSARFFSPHFTNFHFYLAVSSSGSLRIYENYKCNERFYYVVFFQNWNANKIPFNCFSSYIAISKCRFTLYNEKLMARSSNFSQYYFHVIFSSKQVVNKIYDFVS